MSENSPVISIDQKNWTDPDGLFESTKREEREMSAQQATIEVIGKLSGGENSDLWQGKISLDTRLESGEIEANELTTIPELVNRFYVPVSKGAALRCVDGSSLQGYDKNSPTSYARPLGPQIQGGIAGEAQARRLWLGPNAGATLLTDIDESFNDYSRDYLPGDHTDDVVGEDATGCGAIDKYATKISLLADSTRQKSIEATADAIMASGEKMTPVGAFERIAKNAEALNRIEGYLPPAKDTLAKIRSLNPNGVEVLVRPHPEASLTINWVANTTHDRDAYNAETDSRIGNFSLDAWAIFEELGEEVGYAAIVDAVVTVMAITDGSQILLVRRLAEEEPISLAA
jgi:hypothetical protein